MTSADNRPRIHIWPAGDQAAWSDGPRGARKPASTPGAALDEAIAAMAPRQGYVVIGEFMP